MITIGKYVSDIFHEEAQAAFLNKIGCTRLQGYLFGKPIPKEELYQRIDKKELTVSDHLL